MENEMNRASSCRTADSTGHDRIWAQIDMDALIFNMESMRANIREETKMVAVLDTARSRS